MVRRNKKIVFFLISTLVLGAVGAYFLLNKPSEPTLPGQSQEDKHAAQETAKNAAIERTENSRGLSNESSTGNEADIISITRIYKEAQSVVAQTALDNNFSWRSCSLQVTSETGAVVKTTEAEVIFQEPKSLCAGFSIPVSELQKGKLTFILTGTTNDGKHYETQNTFTL